MMSALQLAYALDKCVNFIRQHLPHFDCENANLHRSPSFATHLLPN